MKACSIKLKISLLSSFILSGFSYAQAEILISDSSEVDSKKNYTFLVNPKINTIAPAKPNRPTRPELTPPVTPLPPVILPPQLIEPPIDPDVTIDPIPPPRPPDIIDPIPPRPPVEPPAPPVEPPAPPVEPPAPPVEPPAPPVEPPAPPVEPPAPPDTIGDIKPYHPEIGSYLANLAAANTLFVLTLDDREGGTEYFDPMSGEMKKTAMWLRQEAGQNRFSAASGQLKTQANRYVVQLGGEIANGSWSQYDSWNLGIMAGYASQHANTLSKLTGYRTNSKIDGYSAGMYGSWFERSKNEEGWYIDSWALYNWFDNEISSEGQAGRSWKSRGFTASLEAGHILQLAQYERSAVYIQPQAQIIRMDVKNRGTLIKENGAHIKDVNKDNIQTRLGVRMYIKGHSTQDDSQHREFKPYVEANWIHNSEQFGIRSDGETVSIDGSRDIVQIKLGIQGQLTSSLNLWGGTSLKVGENSYSDASVMLGVKYQF